MIALPINADSINDDHESIYVEYDGLINSLYINLIIFAILMIFFEIFRSIYKNTYLNRASSDKNFKRTGRVPPIPSKYPFAWIISVMEVGENDLLQKVGLDGYMLIRYINVCFRMSVFTTICGILVLIPVYSNASGDKVSWNKYTLANIPNNPSANELWIPPIFAYIYSIYFCHLMHKEYKNFVLKRIDYLIQGDLDTPDQTYYTIMVEKVRMIQ